MDVKAHKKDLSLNKYRSQIGLILLSFVAFISLGLPDGLIGVAWPSIREHFSLRLDALGMLLIASTAGYITSSFLSGKLIAKLGVGGTLAASCFLTTTGLIGYTFVPAWWMMVLLGVILGLGAGAIDAGLNTYVASHFGEGLMQWLHASFGVGVTLGPLIMTAGLNFFNAWQWGYRAVGTSQMILAACFLLTIPMWQNHDPHPHEEAQPTKLTDYKTSITETLKQPSVWMSLLLFFIYTGVELSFGSWTYSLLTLSRNVPTDVAGLWSGSYWATFTLGRILAGLLTRRLGVKNLLVAGQVMAVCGAALLWWNPFPAASIIAVSVIGFALAPIFPGLVSLTSLRVGDHHAANTIGMQISAAGLGAALIPGLAGVLAQNISLEIIPAYITILLIVLISLYYLTSYKTNEV
ncbi:MAG: MFS transporter [Anaerolineales bacterium]|nr:MFS transporter [Anaerolineales bacterium]